MLKSETAKGIVDRLAYVLIVASIGAIIVESHDLSDIMRSAIGWFNVVAYTFFSVEYLLRVYWAAKQRATLKYVTSFFGVIDLLAILPFYLPLVFTVDTRVIRILRLLRLVNLLKLGRHSKAISNLIQVVRSIRYEVAVTLFTSLLLVVFSGILMFYAEHEAQPEVFTNMSQSIWWAIATLTTVGYGDIYPITPLGKVLAACVAFVGVGLVAIPAGLISAAYVEQIKKK
jgi:voltage-gated potassium channel